MFNQKFTLLVLLLTVFASFGFVLPIQHQIHKPKQTELLFSKKSKKGDKKTWLHIFQTKKEEPSQRASNSSRSHCRLSTVAFRQNKQALNNWRYSLHYQAPTKIPSPTDSPLPLS